MQAFIQQEDCVLLSEGWREIQLAKTSNFESIMVDRLLRIFSTLPSLARLVRTVHTMPSTMDQAVQYGEALQEELSLLSAEAKQHFSTSDLSFRSAEAQSKDEIFPSSLHFRSRESAIFHCWLWAATIVVNVYMTSLSTHQQDIAASRWMHLAVDASARKICMSCEYAATLKPLGAQFIQLPLICAYFVSSEHEKLWILEKINFLVVDSHVRYTRTYCDTLSAVIMGNLSM